MSPSAPVGSYPAFSPLSYPPNPPKGGEGGPGAPSLKQWCTKTVIFCSSTIPSRISALSSVRRSVLPGLSSSRQAESDRTTCCECKDMKNLRNDYHSRAIAVFFKAGILVVQIGKLFIEGFAQSKFQLSVPYSMYKNYPLCLVK